MDASIAPLAPLAPLPPLPWIVHGVGCYYDSPVNLVVYFGYFKTRVELLRLLTRKLFGDDNDLLVQFCLDLVFGRDVPGNDLWSIMFERSDVYDQLTFQFVTCSGEMCECEGYPYFKVSSIDDRDVDVLNQDDTYETEDLFDGMCSTLTDEWHMAVVHSIYDDSLMDRIRVMTWVYVVRNNNGFEGNINARVKSFLVGDVEWDDGDDDGSSGSDDGDDGSDV